MSAADLRLVRDRPATKAVWSVEVRPARGFAKYAMVSAVDLGSAVRLALEELTLEGQLGSWQITASRIGD